jgi:AcrR family transcriptional regulator
VVLLVVVPRLMVMACPFVRQQRALRAVLTVLDWSRDATLTLLGCRERDSKPLLGAGPEGGPLGRRPAEVARRAPVNLERALVAALSVADAEGIEAVTMRRLARELGVEAASLYHHVRGKDEILDALVDAIAAEIELPGPSTDWRVAISQRARSTRSVLRRHPWAVSLMASRTTPGAATLRLLEAGIRSFREGGFTVPLAAHAVSAVDSYVHGFVLQEVNLPFRDESELAAMTGAILESFPVSEFPFLFELTTQHVLQPGYDYGNEFDSGLTLVLDGVASSLQREGVSTRSAV